MSWRQKLVIKMTFFAIQRPLVTFPAATHLIKALFRNGLAANPLICTAIGVTVGSLLHLRAAV